MTENQIYTEPDWEIPSDAEVEKSVLEFEDEKFDPDTVED